MVSFLKDPGEILNYILIRKVLCHRLPGFQASATPWFRNLANIHVRGATSEISRIPSSSLAMVYFSTNAIVYIQAVVLPRIVRPEVTPNRSRSTAENSASAYFQFSVVAENTGLWLAVHSWDGVCPLSGRARHNYLIKRIQDWVA